ncbi:VasL domain-containing protein [Intestinirhabdus alba]|jgi:type VI secretion system protein VasL|uniref:Type VI secretion system protein VasL n=1 Tax=Intestinirhabdus alba TaxID=2899544 RepID=A0A6L6IRA0_9ENTR|nr:VasL domain-containing protein [Intestinirhabdus alba]MTH48775.1 hypothetical protein [Intestinirhabdus alba]
MTTTLSERHLRSGGDPRTLADYTALRDELKKLTHPARPDVNWPRAEKLCLSLFEQNGVELQTAAWYTLARAHICGLYGMNEGLAIVVTLVSRQWGSLWPQPVHARMEILSALSKRLQQTMRSLSLSCADLEQLYQVEQHLSALDDVLQRQELKGIGQLETLRNQVHSTAVRLENSGSPVDDEPQTQTGILLPAGSADTVHEPEEARAERVQWIYIAQPEPQPNVGVAAAPPVQATPWRAFLSGALAMLVVGGVLLWGWQNLLQPQSVQARLAASLRPLPVVLSDREIDELRQSPPAPEAGIRDTGQQLERIAQLTPDWHFRYGQRLVQQAQALWPEQAIPLADRWQQQQRAAELPAEQLNGWYQGMAQLQQLANRLNALDEKRGKYMTVSELKSEVFAITQSFNGAVPVAEQLRQLMLIPADQPLPAAQIARTESSLNALLILYAQLSARELPAEAGR